MTAMPSPSAPAPPPIEPPEGWKDAWEIGWPREAFNALKDDPCFLQVLTIARMRNVLRFMQGLIVFPPKDVSAAVRRRHTLNSFFFTNSVLIEAELVVNGSARLLEDNEHYPLIAQAVRDPRFVDLLDRTRRVRHQCTFHFDPRAAQDAMKLGYFAEAPDFVPFLMGEGIRDFEISADLADQVPIELIIRDEERDNVEESFKVWLDEASKVTTALLRALDEFLAGVASDFGAVHRQQPQTESKNE